MQISTDAPVDGRKPNISFQRQRRDTVNLCEEPFSGTEPSQWTHSSLSGDIMEFIQLQSKLLQMYFLDSFK